MIHILLNFLFILDDTKTTIDTETGELVDKPTLAVLNTVVDHHQNLSSTTKTIGAKKVQVMLG